MNHLVSCGKIVLVHDQGPDPIISLTPHKSNVNCAIWNHNSISKILFSYRFGYSILWK